MNDCSCSPVFPVVELQPQHICVYRRQGKDVSPDRRSVLRMRWLMGTPKTWARPIVAAVRWFLCLDEGDRLLLQTIALLPLLFGFTALLFCAFG